MKKHAGGNIENLQESAPSRSSISRGSKRISNWTSGSGFEIRGRFAVPPSRDFVSFEIFCYHCVTFFVGWTNLYWFLAVYCDLYDFSGSLTAKFSVYSINRQNLLANSGGQCKQWNYEFYSRIGSCIILLYGKFSVIYPFILDWVIYLFIKYRLWPVLISKRDYLFYFMSTRWICMSN